MNEKIKKISKSISSTISTTKDSKKSFNNELNFHNKKQNENIISPKNENRISSNIYKIHELEYNENFLGKEIKIPEFNFNKKNISNQDFTKLEKRKKTKKNEEKILSKSLKLLISKFNENNFVYNNIDKNSNDGDKNNFKNILTVKNKQTVIDTCSKGIEKLKEDKYSGLARNLVCNKSFEIKKENLNNKNIQSIKILNKLNEEKIDKDLKPTDTINKILNDSDISKNNNQNYNKNILEIEKNETLNKNELNKNFEVSQKISIEKVNFYNDLSIIFLKEKDETKKELNLKITKESKFINKQPENEKIYSYIRGKEYSKNIFLQNFENNKSKNLSLEKLDKLNENPKENSKKVLKELEHMTLNKYNDKNLIEISNILSKSKKSLETLNEEKNILNKNNQIFILNNENEKNRNSKSQKILDLSLDKNNKKLNKIKGNNISIPDLREISRSMSNDISISENNKKQNDENDKKQNEKNNKKEFDENNKKQNDKNNNLEKKIRDNKEKKINMNTINNSSTKITKIEDKKQNLKINQNHSINKITEISTSNKILESKPNDNNHENLKTKLTKKKLKKKIGEKINQNDINKNKELNNYINKKIENVIKNNKHEINMNIYPKNNIIEENYIKKLEFDNLKKTNFTKEKFCDNIIYSKINNLLDSKSEFVLSEKDNEMNLIIENEQILKNEIYSQKMTEYNDDFLLKKSINFINDINFDDFSLFESDNKLSLNQSNINSKIISKNELDDLNKNTNYKSYDKKNNPNILLDNKYELEISQINHFFENNDTKDNNNQFQNLSRSTSQIFMKNSQNTCNIQIHKTFDKKNNPFSNLKKIHLILNNHLKI